MWLVGTHLQSGIDERLEVFVRRLGRSPSMPGKFGNNFAQAGGETGSNCVGGIAFRDFPPGERTGREARACNANYKYSAHPETPARTLPAADEPAS